MLEFLKNYFIVIPLLLLIITILLIAKLIKQKKEYKETTGTIVDFYKNTSELRLGDNEHVAIAPIIKYFVNNKEYQIIGNYYSTSMKKGDSVKIIYNLNSPNKGKVKKALELGIIILSIFTILSFITMIIIKLI